MKFYPKKLHSVDDLEKERRALHKEAKGLNETPLLGGKDGDKKSADSMGGLQYFLPLANPLGKLLVKIVERKVLHKNPSEAGEASKSSKKKMGVKGIAVEVLGGYLKWKAIELTYKAVKGAINKRKEAKAQSSSEVPE